MTFWCCVLTIACNHISLSSSLHIEFFLISRLMLSPLPGIHLFVLRTISIAPVWCFSIYNSAIVSWRFTFNAILDKAESHWMSSWWSAFFIIWLDPWLSSFVVEILCIFCPEFEVAEGVHLFCSTTISVIPVRRNSSGTPEWIWVVSFALDKAMSSMMMLLHMMLLLVVMMMLLFFMFHHFLVMHFVMRFNLSIMESITMEKGLIIAIIFARNRWFSSLRIKICTFIFFIWMLTEIIPEVRLFRTASISVGPCRSFSFMLMLLLKHMLFLR